MTGLAGDAVGMFGGIHLRKVFGPGGTGCMAAHAEHGGIGLARIDGWIVGVFCERAVAGLAVHVGVFAGAFCLGNIAVAGFAGLMAGEMDGMSGDFGDGRAAVVSILAEAAGNDEAADEKKSESADSEQTSKAEEMPGISELAHDPILLNVGPGNSGSAREP